jgi:hypothetical protein
MQFLEIKAPFNPADAAWRVRELLLSYGLHATTGDRYAVQWVVSEFAKGGIAYVHCEKDKSALYLEALPLFSSGRCRLVDSARLVNQIVSLERRVSPGGRDRIEHPRGSHDDVANAALGALALAVGEQRMHITPQLLDAVRRAPTRA